MPISPSAIKRMRSDSKKHARNLAAQSEIKTAKKNFHAALQEDQEKAKQAGVWLVKRADQAAKRGMIPKGRANRIKARVALALQSKSARASK